jgi:hypothetical protein
MLLFPAEVQSILTHLVEQLEFDQELMEACQTAFESEDHPELISAASGILAQRLGRKSGQAVKQVVSGRWADEIQWEAAGFGAERAKALIDFCEAVLVSATALAGTAAASRAVLLMVNALLAELGKLPDLSQPDEEPNGIDARPFFDELVKSLNALLPYEQRDFPTEMGPSQVKLLLADLIEGAYYAVEIFAPTEDQPGRLEMGIHFESGDMEKLTRHFKRKIPGLSHSLGGKEIILREQDGHLAILLEQKYQPTEKLSAFMTAATLVGLVGSIQERMPRR